MRGNKPEKQKANHIVSAWCDMDGFCLDAFVLPKVTKSLTNLFPVAIIGKVLV